MPGLYYFILKYLNKVLDNSNGYELFRDGNTILNRTDCSIIFLIVTTCQHEAASWNSLRAVQKKLALNLNIAEGGDHVHH